MYGLYAHSRADDLDLDARSPWLGGGKHSALNYLDNKQTISITLATTVAHMLHDYDYDFENICMV